VIEEAYALNTPLLAVAAGEPPGGGLPTQFSLAQSGSGQVVVETVKQSETGDAWVFRVYEPRQARSAAATLELGRPIRRAVECNLIEEDEHPAVFTGNRLTFPILPFEIKTFKVWFEAP
jgi:alpha-mannosidase